MKQNLLHGEIEKDGTLTLRVAQNDGTIKVYRVVTEFETIWDSVELKLTTNCTRQEPVQESSKCNNLPLDKS